MSPAIFGLLLAAAGATAVSPAQDTRASTRPDDPAARLIAAIDARLYSAEASGLRSVEFAYRPVASGPRETTPFRVRVRWEKGKRETVEFQKPDGSAFAELPEILRSEKQREDYERGARALVAMFRGVPYSETYSKWRKRLEVVTVNGRDEKTIVCEPFVAGSVLRVEISLDPKDLPWRIVNVLARPEAGIDRMIDQPTWTEFDGKLVMTDFKKTRASLEEIAIQYQRKDGFIVPASFERLVVGKPPVKTVFEDVKLSR